LVVGRIIEVEGHATPRLKQLEQGNWRLHLSFRTLQNWHETARDGGGILLGFQ
jgi:hypothetical protein